MNSATPAQRAILESDARIRVVRAAPGSGKTWLVAHAMAKENLQAWRSAQQGIAALSFTNVAGEEIRRALGYTPHHPHFVGTIDAFLYRYVVRPFARAINPAIEVTPRLIPADAAERLSQHQYWFQDTSIGYSIRRASNHKPITGTLYDCDFVGKAPDGNLQAVFDAGWNRIPLTHDEVREVLHRKKELWRTRGRMSHSDVAYIAAAILDSPKGYIARTVLAHRFPLLVVDELQDTGFFRSRALLRLLSSTTVRGLLVGDPDQAIYGFSGAHPDIFREFECLPDAECFGMRQTVRCGNNICRVATAVAESGHPTEAIDGTRMGRSVLLTHDGDQTSILHLASEIRRQVPISEGKIALLARKNNEVNRLLGRAQRVAPKFHSPPVTSLYHAVQALHEGRMTKARAAVEAALGRIVFGTDVPGPDDLVQVGLPRPEWKLVVAQILFNAAYESNSNENAYEWGCRMLEEVEALLLRRGWLAWCKPRMPKRPRQSTQNDPRPTAEKRRGEVEGSLEIQTVHATKGETHHTTIYYLPRVPAAQCPSRVWWPGENDDGEERRIAFVAASRPRDTLIFVVHEESFERLQQAHPAFLEMFSIHPLRVFLEDTRALMAVPSTEPVPPSVGRHSGSPV